MKTLDVNLVLSQLDPHHKQINEHDANSILARWEFGRVLRAHIPEGKKQLPKGLRDEVTEHFQLEASEITRRLQLAKKFENKMQLMDACIRCGNSWRRIIREELVKRREDGPLDAILWADSAKSRLDKLLAEAGESDELQDELVNLLVLSLRELGYDFEVAA